VDDRAQLDATMYPERTEDPDGPFTVSDVLLPAQTSGAAGFIAGISSAALRLSCNAM
jgi:hypothetical protein